MGKLLNSESITIWTDVDGVLSADPRRVPSAHVIPEVSFNEAMELAYFGAKVIHPKTMQPAISASPQIPIYIRNTFHSHLPGSRIFTTSTTAKDQDKCVCGFSSIENMAVVNVEGSGLIGVPGVAKRLFGTLEELGVNVIMISQASSEHSITFVTLESQAEIAKAGIEEEFHRELKANRISNVDIQAPVSVIGAVGDGMHAMAGVSGRFFSALGNAKINVVAISQGCSERNISAVVWAHDSTRALRAVHAAFRLSISVVRIAVIGMNPLGESLLSLLQSQRKKMYDVFEVDHQVCVVASNGSSSELVCLNDDYVGDFDSITLDAYTELTYDESSILRQEAGGNPVKTVAGGIELLDDILISDECAHHVIFDCTADPAVAALHAKWLRDGVHVVTANNTGLSGSQALRTEIAEAEKMQGKLSAKYCNEVTVGGALPIISTVRGLLNSGDSIRRIDGIFSTAMSFIMFRISPCPRTMESFEFDKASSNGHFSDMLTMMPCDKVGVACSFTQAVCEANALGLMEDDPCKDLDNMYSARSVLILARELGMNNRTVEDIADNSEKLIDTSELEGVSIDSWAANEEITKKLDALVHERVAAAEAKGCVLRSISSVDVKTQTTEIRLVEVPSNHIFATTPPSCECFRFFTQRYHGFPLIVQGPAAGADSTASALLAEKLRLIHAHVIDFTKVEAGTGALTRNDTSFFSRRASA
jgi:aspartokinase/homoserine dehydrogenase 1